jgi:uncharacterized protein with FMN-binding domain
LTGFFVFQKIEDNLESLSQIEIEDINLSSIEDGLYRGKYKVIPIEVIIDVRIENHLITEMILIKHSNGKGELAEMILDDVIINQSLDVDLVTGASYSSLVILLAISDALRIS